VQSRSVLPDRPEKPAAGSFPPPVSFSIRSFQETLISAPPFAAEQKSNAKSAPIAECFHADLNKSAFP